MEGTSRSSPGGLASWNRQRQILKAHNARPLEGWRRLLTRCNAKSALSPVACSTDSGLAQVWPLAIRTRMSPQSGHIRAAQGAALRGRAVHVLMEPSSHAAELEDLDHEMYSGPRSSTLVQPIKAMVRLISEAKLVSTWSTPGSPAAPKP